MGRKVLIVLSVSQRGSLLKVKIKPSVSEKKKKDFRFSM